METATRAEAGDDDTFGAGLRGALRGAVAGALLGLVDTLAVAWLLSTDLERVDLLARSLLLSAPLGAAVGAALCVLHWFGIRRIERRASARGADVDATRRRYAPLPLTLALSPLMAAVAWLLFSGPSASELALRPLFVVCAFLFLGLGTWAALRLGFAASRFATTARRGAVVATISLVALVAASRADEVLYPALYDYLHACLTAAAFGFAWLVVDVIVPLRLGVRASLATVALLAATMIANLSSFGMSPTVRATLLDPRASHARSAMLAIGPLLSPANRAPEDAIARARRARARRRAAIGRADLPTWQGGHTLLITVDALRPDHLGLHGYERPTSPFLDRFAEDAVVFDRAYAQAPHSSYSLSSLMTSEYLHEAAHAGAVLPEPTLASALAGAGYRTAALFPLGIFHTEGQRLTPYAESRFLFEHADTRDLGAADKTDAAIETLEEIARAGEPPSFTWVHYFDVHEPYRATRFGRTDVDRYDSEIAKVDAEIERLVEAAEEILAGELIVIVSADHGEEFREHGGVYHGFTLYEEQIRVPLLVRAPGLRAARVAAPVELVDLAPTVLGMLGLPPPPTMRGDDLRGLLAGDATDVGPAFAGVGPRRMVVRHPFKLIANLRFGVFELFDLSEDPRERDNLAARNAAKKEELEAEIFAWLDSLAHPPDAATEETDPGAIALVRGRLGDHRAVAPLIDLLGDEEEEPVVRAEAARLLGVLGEGEARNPLRATLTDEHPEVRAESAIALGRLYDASAAEPLALLLEQSELPPPARARASIALARLGDERALPSLPDAARTAPSRREQNEAIRQLGQLGSEAQLEPLAALLPDFRTRRPAALALGHLGDPRALPLLLSVLDSEDHATIRDAVVKGLGRLGDPDAIPRLAALLANEPDLRSTAESLVRLDAIGRGAIGGTDVGPGIGGLRGVTDCTAEDADDPYRFAGRTRCTVVSHAELPLATPEVVTGAVDGIILVTRLARLEGSERIPVDLTLADTSVGTLSIDSEPAEYRLALDAAMVHDGVVLSLDTTAPVWVDHVLLVPQSTTLARSGLAD